MTFKDSRASAFLETLREQLMAEIEKEREEIIAEHPGMAAVFERWDAVHEEMKPKLHNLLMYGDSEGSACEQTNDD